jgi:hypothetical protein
LFEQVYDNSILAHVRRQSQWDTRSQLAAYRFEGTVLGSRTEAEMIKFVRSDGPRARCTTLPATSRAVGKD